MTQILAAITTDCAFLVADRRLTYGAGCRKGEVASEDECKVVSLCHVNVIGYTGLARFGRVPTNEWIGTALAEAGCHHAGQAAETLASRAPAALHSIPAELRRHAFLMCGWAPFGPEWIMKPHMAVISNCHHNDMNPSATARDSFRINTRTLQPGEQAAVFAVGEHLRPDRDVALLRSIRRANGREGSEAAVMRLLAEEIFRTSAHARTVGDEVQACCIPVASAHSLFTSGASRMSGLRSRPDRSTFGYFDRSFNEYKQFGPTFVCGAQAFTDVKYERSRTGPETSMSFRVLYAPKKQL